MKLIFWSSLVVHTLNRNRHACYESLAEIPLTSKTEHKIKDDRRIKKRILIEQKKEKQESKSCFDPLEFFL